MNLLKGLHLWLIQFTPICLAGWMLGGDRLMSLPECVRVVRNSNFDF